MTVAGKSDENVLMISELIVGTAAAVKPGMRFRLSSQDRVD